MIHNHTMTVAYQRVIESDYLYCQTGNSDKVYEVELVAEATGRFSVNACYGRRGSTLNNAPKVQNTYEDAARAEYRKLVEEKLAKGYQRRGVANNQHPRHEVAVRSEITHPPSSVGTRRKTAKQLGFVVGPGRKLVID